MERLLYTVCALYAAVLLLSGCQKEEKASPEPDVPAAGAPVITLGQELLSFTAEEGSYELTYAVENPVDGGKVSAGSDEGWITPFNCDTDGVVTFTVSANDEQQGRTARITVTYTYADGKVEAVADAVQEAAEAAEPPAGQYDYDYDLEYIAEIIMETRCPMTVTISLLRLLMSRLKRTVILLPEVSSTT